MKTTTVLWGLLWFALVGSVLAGTGGPDEEGYRWIDSDTTGGPVYNWFDITGIGSAVTFTEVPGAGPHGADDEGYAAKSLGFSFPFYGNSYDTVYIHSNGHLGFEFADVYLNTWPNDPVPDPDRPNNSIFAYWDDFDQWPDPSRTAFISPGRLFTSVWFWTNNADSAIVEYEEWYRHWLLYPETFEVILLGSGEIYTQYEVVSRPAGYIGITVGTESVGGTTGLEYIYNGVPPYDTLHPGLCIRFYHQDFLNEVKAVSIDTPGELVEPDSFTSPKATVKNRSVNPATFDVRCIIRDTLTVEVYGDTQQVTNLLPDSIYQVEFDPWLVGAEGNRYGVFVQTMLPGDEYPANDTLSIQTVAFHEVKVINSPYTYTVPTFDGSIDTVSEWGDAVRVDISDVLGRSGPSPEPSAPRSVILYTKNDSSHLYFASDCRTDTSLDDWDLTDLYIDDNHDGIWESGDMEGRYLASHHATGDTIIFYAAPTWTPYAIPAAEIRIELTNGHLQHEFSLPIGTNNYELNTALGDTIGLCYATYDAGTACFDGWWPTTMPYSRWYNPAYYGDLVLGIGPGVGEAPEARSKMQQANLSQNYPNPFRAATKILYVTTDLGYVTPSHTSLQIYDIAGRLVRTLVHKKLQRGRYTVSWDGKDSGGTDVAAGIYFYQLRVGNLRITKKMSVVR